MSTVADCVFCELIGSGDARWVHRGLDAVAFLPLPEGALAPGHTLVVPRAHCVGVLDADAPTMTATMDLVQRVARAMTSALGATGVVLLNASGPGSGQSVDHLHVHVVPRWPDDGVDLWPADRSAHAPVPGVHDVLAAELAQR
ncbi:MAG: HIT domain-containing protein [Candidatus Nanopelagicales bacterium]